ARMGASVAMVGRVGQDGFGRELVEGLRRDGVNAEWVRALEGATTGIASIWVEQPGGANAIAVVAGANGLLQPRDVEAAAELLGGAQAVLLQLEVPLATVEAAVKLCRQAGVRAVLDPAPARAEVAGWLGRLWAVTPNQQETEVLVGVPVRSPEEGARACRALLDRGVAVAVVKMGEQGVVVGGEPAGGIYHVPALPVQAVDTTAAGDSFAGALAACLAEGMELVAACRWANAAAALSTTRPGAQPSLPRRHEVQELVSRLGLPQPRRIG
ncbi:MAG TPA: ribokinase, partial [Limnochordales bacterium]